MFSRAMENSVLETLAQTPRTSVGCAHLGQVPTLLAILAGGMNAEHVDR